MKIRDCIEKIFKERLMQFPCLTIYDPNQRYREIAMRLAGEYVTVVEADKSTILGREQAMAAWTEIVSTIINYN